MTMPKNLVLVRHGQSEGNIATEAAKKGDLRYYEADSGRFMTVPGHQWRLTDLGREQAATIGAWLDAEFGAGGPYENFNRQYVSPFVRTRETAAWLSLPESQWTINRAIRERDWGDIGSIPWSDFQSNYGDNAHIRDIDPLYWMPVNGESIAHVAENRVRNFLSTLHRECEDQTILAVTHSDTMWAFRLVLEYWKDEDFVVADADKSQKIHNCEAFHYTRINPEDPSNVESHLTWMRRVHPRCVDGVWGVESSQWIKMKKDTLSNQDLLDSIRDVPSLFASQD